MRHAKVIAEDALEILPAKPGVPRLRGLVKQALFGGHERPAAVYVDAAAFEAHVASPLGAGAGAKEAQLERLRHTLGYGVVLTPVRILGPGVEAESSDNQFGGRPRAPHEERAEVARPTSVGRPVEEFYARGVNARAPEHAPRLPLDVLRGKDSDGLAWR